MKGSFTRLDGKGWGQTSTNMVMWRCSVLLPSHSPACQGERQTSLPVSVLTAEAGLILVMDLEQQASLVALI